MCHWVTGCAPTSRLHTDRTSRPMGSSVPRCDKESKFVDQEKQAKEEARCQGQQVRQLKEQAQKWACQLEDQVREQALGQARQKEEQLCRLEEVTYE
ncbi:hypothetical protein EVAR_96764_1 [Eumeta japonica]|uniref:Uncharacterized protein n=1 Tax=Eumeta variegata TaxID=151549 RepID=A0A4C1WUP0_EUMVA|nr:hypothetical protein EVAR_96764_1 [Eumeta japonica]